MNLFGRDGIEHVDLAPERQRELAGLLPAGHPHVRPGAGDVDGVGRDVLDHAAHAGGTLTTAAGRRTKASIFFLFRGGEEDGRRDEGEGNGGICGGEGGGGRI